MCPIHFGCGSLLAVMMAAFETKGSNEWRRREKGKVRAEPTAEERQQAVRDRGKGGGKRERKCGNGETKEVRSQRH